MKISGAVAKELSKTRFYSATAYEKYVAALPRESPYVVADNGCDVTVVGQGFCIKKVYPKIDGANSGIASPFDMSCTIDQKVDAIATYLDHNGNPKAIIEVKQAYYHKHGKESLLAEAQLRWSGNKIDSTLGIHGGNQVINTPKGDIDLMTDGKTAYFNIRKPTNSDKKKLPTSSSCKNP